MTDADQQLSPQPQLIAVAKLKRSAVNARKTTRPDGIEELKASILAHGLLQNLVVTAAGDGTYFVIAGGRRLHSIQMLQAEGRLPQDFAVPCQVVTDLRALEMSLAENTVRLAMHPADQFEAFATLIEQGQSAADVARRFGVDESLVLKRIKLARVALQLVKEYRDDGMTLECLMAYTIIDDHRRQLKVFKSLQTWQKDDPTAIRAALTEKMIDATDKLACFVGIEAYRAAGGAIRTDLFGDETYLEDPTLLQRLVVEKLEGIRQQLEDDGWSWITLAPDRDHDAVYRCGRIKPQLIGVPAELLELKSRLDAELAAMEDDDEAESLQVRVDEVEQQLAAFVGFDETQKRLAGCYVSIGQDGLPFVDQGLVRPEHRKALATLLGEEHGSHKTAQAKAKDGLPESLRRSLAAERLPIAQLAIASHPQLAQDLLTFTLATKLLDGCHRMVDVGLDCHRPRERAGRDSASDAARKLAELERHIRIGWCKSDVEADRFEAFCSLSEGEKQALLAYCVALVLQPRLGPSNITETSAYDTTLSRTEVNVAEFWRPAKENFLARRNREQLLAIGSEVLGEQWSQSRTGDKKSSLVEQLDRAFSNPAKAGRTPEQIQRLKNWLPSGMGFEATVASKPAKVKKVRKAA